MNRATANLIVTGAVTLLIAIALFLGYAATAKEQVHSADRVWSLAGALLALAGAVVLVVLT